MSQAPPDDRCIVRFPTTQGTLKMEVSLPQGELRLADLVPLAQQVTDITVKISIDAEVEEGRSLSCKAGCGACCRQLVPISAPEAFVIAEWVDSLPVTERDAIRARVSAAERNLDDRGMLATLRELMQGSTKFDADGLSQAYFDLGIPCPFLVDESCGAYSYRPLVCRDFNVTSPAAWCAKPRLHVIRKIPMPPCAAYPLARLTSRLTGDPVRLVPLTMALRFAEESAELAQRSWPARELFTGFLEELERNS